MTSPTYDAPLERLDTDLEGGLSRNSLSFRTIDKPDLFEPVLKVEIPATIEIRETKSGTRRLLPVPTGDDVDWTPFPDDPGSTWTDFSQSIDRSLKEHLSTTRAISGPLLSPTHRLLVDIGAPYYELLFSELDVPKQTGPSRHYTTYRIYQHDFAPDKRGSHFSLIFNPRKASPEQLNLYHILSKLLLNEAKPSDMIRSTTYIELYGLVTERLSSRSIVSQDADATVRERISRIDQELRTARRRSSGAPTEILRFLHDPDVPGPALSLGEIEELLHDMHDVVPHDRFLAFVLLDLARGKDPETLPGQSAFWEQSDAYAGMNDMREASQTLRETHRSHPSLRQLQTTFESISVETNRVVRQWWSYNPPRPFPVWVIKHCLLVRQVLEEFRLKHGCSPVLSTGNPVIQLDDTHYQLMFHYKGTHPFRRAMRDDIDPKALYDLFSSLGDVDAFATAFRDATKRAVESVEHTTAGEARDWIFA